MLRILLIIALTLLLSIYGPAQTLPIPARTTNAIFTANFVHQIETLTLAEREQAIASEFLKGNTPSQFRDSYPLAITNVLKGKTNVATIFVTCDYLGIGDDTNFFRTPLTPATAQHIADELGCTLPTRKIVDAIHAAAEIRLAPQPIPPDAAMTTVPVFATHNEIIRTQLVAFGSSPTSTTLIAGHKKDVVISTRLAAFPGNVAIYGWHRTNGTAIQPLYIGHRSDWVDYSHGIRLVQQRMILNGETTTVARVLADPALSRLLSDEGVVTNSRYGASDSRLLKPSLHEPRSRGSESAPSESGRELDDMRRLTSAATTAEEAAQKSGQHLIVTNNFAECITTLSPAPEVTVEINSPSAKEFAPDKPVLLILYALPNGNTTAQTVGKKLSPGDDWHFDIQHIGAQTRFLRAALTNRNVVIAYLETKMKSWPAWRRTHGDKLIPEVVARVKKYFSTNQLELVLTGHSGGGSFTFGYLNSITNIPADVKRIAFLDSNYAYETTNHFAKLTAWLKASDENNLSVLAYHDSIALLNGKTFVSERGGTWGRSHAMLNDLRREWSFTSSTNSVGLRSHVTARGRIQFLLKENPERKILHTVQVERNGFIHTMLTGTPLENVGYDYFGERAYGRWIQAE